MTLDEFNFFFRVSGDIEKELWGKAVFVFDTSSILEMYYYSEPSRQQIFNKLFPAIKGQLWITDHTSYEYLKNRESVIKKSFSEKYSKIKKDQLKSIDTGITSINNSLKEISDRTKNKDIHPFLNQSIFEEVNKSIELFKNEFDSFQKKFDEEVNEREKELKKLETQDDIHKSIVKYFKITDRYEFSTIESIINASDARFSNNIPPGFKDAQGGNKKDGLQRFGDLIIWHQLLDLANKLDKPIIFITNDSKEDWWDTVKEDRERLRPKEDLIVEFKSKTKKQFWAYSFSDFLYKAKEILIIDITPKALEEIEKVTEFLEDKSINKGAFKYSRNQNGGYVFSLYTPNGLPILHSDKYSTTNSCLDGILQLKKGEVFGISNYQIVNLSRGGFYFDLLATNGQIIATSIMFSSENECYAAINICKKIIPDAQIIEVVL